MTHFFCVLVHSKRGSFVRVLKGILIGCSFICF